MSIAPIINKVQSNVQGLEKKTAVIIKPLTQTPGEKMGAWTMMGYGMKGITEKGKLLFRSAEYGKPLNSVNYLA